MKILRYEVGWSESNILGSGCEYHVSWEGKSEDEAMEAFRQPGNDYMSRLVSDNGQLHKHWYNPHTKEWEHWY